LSPAAAARETFFSAFGREPEAVAAAPGRVNLLGEHTDYNDGYVLPLAIPQQVHTQLARGEAGVHHFRSVQLGAVDVVDGEPSTQGYGPYVQGCIEVLRGRGFDVPGLLAQVDSTVPIGSGLSSSAALEVSVLRALRLLLALPLDDVELALLAQRAEVDHAGVRCGIMDQMASSLCTTDRMLFLDTRTLRRELLPLPPDVQVLVIDSGVPRELAASGYNARRAECEAAARALEVVALRDVVDPARVESLPEPLRRRARHVVTENARVLRASAGIDAAGFGRLMNASHASLRDDFDVSVRELDRIVDWLQRHPLVHGARLTGAGFGGACVALTRHGRSAEVGREVVAALGGEVPGISVLVS
jgi:galactokinase